MCVLTYLPKANGGFVVTHNRDEAAVREAALPPKRYNLANNHQVLYPQDPQSGGTWIATSSKFTLCLLNGAFENHVRQSSYRQSRGQIIPDFFKFKNPEAFIQNYCFEGIEPFTLIAIEHSTKPILHEIRWDGKVVYHQNLNSQKPHIWSSATLYDQAVRQERTTWFEDWQSQYPDFEANSIFEFHQKGGNGNAHNDMVMNRHGHLLTHCIMQIDAQKNMIRAKYQDLLQNKAYQYSLI